MAKVSFSKKPSAVAGPAPAVETTATVVVETAPVQPAAEVLAAAVPEKVTAVATVTQSAPPAPAPQRPFDDDNIDASDIVIKRINIAQRVGDLGTQFDPGSLVYDKSLVLSEAPKGPVTSKSIRFVVVGFQPKKFVEKVPYGTQGGLTLDSEREVVEAGGTLDYTEAQVKKIPYYERLATALLLIEKPEGLDDAAFPHEINGKRYVLALYSMKGSSYTAAAKPIFTERKMGRLRTNGYRSGFWTFQTVMKKFQNGNAAYVPVVTYVGPTPPELQSAVKELIGF